MATKTHIAGGEYEIESENLSRPVKTDDYIGTAIKLVRALEASGDTLAHITVGKDVGKPKVTLFGRYGDAGEAKPVPQEVHKQLTEWGYTHRGDLDHTDDARSHVYVKG